MTDLDALFTHNQVVAFGKKAMIKKVSEFVESIQTSYFNLGAILLRVREEGLFVDWDGVEYESFDEWCETVLKFRMRKAQHLITIFKGITEIAPGPKLFKRLLDLGWVKVGQILRIADTKQKLKHWAQEAEDLSLREVTGKVNYELEQESGKTIDEKVAAAVSASVTRKFALTEDQNTQLDKALTILSHRFPAQTDGERLSMMVLTYMAGHVDDEKGGIAVELGYLITNIERTYGVKLKIAKKGAKKLKKKLKKVS